LLPDLAGSSRVQAPLRDLAGRNVG